MQQLPWRSADGTTSAASFVLPTAPLPEKAT